MKNQPTIFDQSYLELEELMLFWKQPKFRTKQLWEWLYQKKVSSFDQMSNLPKPLQQRLKSHFLFSGLSTLVDLKSKDRQTRKVLFELHDGKKIEVVHMHYPGHEKKQSRNTLCISSQAGCALGCTFCATGQGGFQRNLSCGEIVEQALFYMRQLEQQNDRVTNIVFMGMGEPFANYDNVMGAVRKLSDPNGIGLGARRLTISTVGLAPQIERFANEQIQVNLAISLHAATDELRSKTMPINDRYPIETLLKACQQYTEKTHRRISFEWAMINQVNDTTEQAVILSQKIKGMLCHVNLIPLNPTQGFNGAASDPQRIADFCAVLDRYGIPNSIRSRKGVDINAACGQLSQAYDRENI